MVFSSLIIISGDTLPSEVAGEIIFRTDEFLTDMSKYAGGNNIKWNKQYQDRSGISKVGESNEDFWEIIDSMKLTESTLHGCYLEIADQLVKKDCKDSIYYNTLGVAMKNWINLLTK